MSELSTNRLKLIEDADVKGVPLLGLIKVPWFDQIVPAKENVVQIVFRGENLVGSVYPPSSSVDTTGQANLLPVKVRRGDIIYTVSLISQPHTLSGVFSTKDGYTRTYQAYLELLVNNPRACVKRYRIDGDPTAWIIPGFKNTFEQTMSRYVHDESNSAKFTLDTLNAQLSTSSGIIIQDFTWSSSIDPRREQECEFQRKLEVRKRDIVAEVEAKVFELRQRTELRKAELTADAELKELEEMFRMSRERTQKQFNRDEKVKQSDFDRGEKMQARLSEARIQFLTKTVNDLTAINSERIHEAFDSDDASVRALLEDSLKLLTVFSEQNYTSEEVVESNLINSDNDRVEEGESGSDAPG